MDGRISTLQIVYRNREGSSQQRKRDYEVEGRGTVINSGVSKFITVLLFSLLYDNGRCQV
jgi:hypothetical protein